MEKCLSLLQTLAWKGHWADSAVLNLYVCTVLVIGELNYSASAANRHWEHIGPVLQVRAVRAQNTGVWQHDVRLRGRPATVIYNSC